MINLNQFEAIIWAKHNTHQPWSKILTMITLVWRMQMRQSWRKQLAKSLNQTNITNVNMYPLRQANWSDIWKHTMETNQTNAIYVTMHRVMQAIWGHVWKHIVEKSQTNANNVTLHLLMQAIFGDTWKRTLEKSRTNATNVILHPFGQVVWGHIWKRTVEKKTNKCGQCDYDKKSDEGSNSVRMRHENSGASTVVKTRRSKLKIVAVSFFLIPILGANKIGNFSGLWKPITMV